MSTERLISGGYGSAVSSSHSLRYGGEAAADRIFEELPTATIVSVSRPDASDITPLLLSYTIELQYKQFKWQLLKKASQVIYLHFALKKRAIIEELHEKQEQVREWLQNVGLGDHATVVHDEDEPDDGAVPIYNDDSVKYRYVPSRAALSIIRPAIGKQQTVSDKAKAAMQGYLNHFLGNLDIINSREVCKFLEVSRVLSMSLLQLLWQQLAKSKYSRLEKGFHVSALIWQDYIASQPIEVWLVLKPGFLAFLGNHFDTKLLDIVIFDVSEASNAKGDHEVHLAKVLKERNPLRHAFQLEDRTIKLRTTSQAKAQEWVSAINAVGSKHSESWCHPHRFNSFAPTRGLVEDGSLAQWFIDGKAAFEAIALSIESAKSEIYITGWWLCPELYLRRPFNNESFSRLDVLLEAKAKEGVQIHILLYKEVSLALKINSLYSKRKLLKIHENVKVLRYPDHLSSGIYLWSHHEKLVIVDHKICFIGGLDLCFGRYDTIEHKVGDFPPFLWPGKDYYNPRESEPNSWEDALKDELDREKYPRMPWHDVHFGRILFHRKTPPDDIPLLLPHEANGPDSSIMYNKSNGLNSSEHYPAEMSGHFTGSSLAYHESNQDTGNNFFDNHDTANLQSATQVEAVSESDLQVEDYWWESQEQTFQVISDDEVTEVGPRSLCHCQVVRSVSQWSAGASQTEDSIHRAYCTLIEEAEYFIYIEGGVDDMGAATVRAIMHWQYRTICRGESSILQKLCSKLGSVAHDFISFFGLRNYGRLFDGGPMVTSQVYVHSKVMIVDDRCALIGSSNINDRSLLGSRDSEIAVLIEDKEFIDSSMNGNPWKAGKFSYSLRLSLWAEHLGLNAKEVAQIKDPIVDTTYKYLWLDIAKANTKIYQDAFSCIPNDTINSRSALRQSMSHWKQKLKHTTIDLGVAPKNLNFIRMGKS
ncbi:hypothetical protein DH2020_024283 [Rehmannia glutinosa]|uniref:Phospholipase n=1 Tax=Rehmannia glutinosa TaxID=99300 RepID=A0ABR0WCN0_REHGL